MIDILTFLLVNIESTVDIFVDGNLLKEIWLENDNMTITTNTRNIVMKLIGYMPVYLHPVWYYPKSLKNIMDYSHLSDNYQIAYDYHKEDTFLLHKNKNKTIK